MHPRLCPTCCCRCSKECVSFLKVQLEPDPCDSAKTLTNVRHSLQQWQLSPLHTSVSVSGCMGRCQNPPGLHTKMRRVHSGRGSEFTEKQLGTGRGSDPLRANSCFPRCSICAEELYRLKTCQTHTYRVCCSECIRLIQSLLPGKECQPVSVVLTSYVPRDNLQPPDPVSRLTAHLSSWNRLRQGCFLQLSDRLSVVECFRGGLWCFSHHHHQWPFSGLGLGFKPSGDLDHVDK